MKKAGVHVEELVKRLVRAASGEFSTFYYSSIMRVARSKRKWGQGHSSFPFQRLGCGRPTFRHSEAERRGSGVDWICSSFRTL